MRDAYWAIFDTDDLIAAGIAPGHELVAAVQRRIDAFAEQYAQRLPGRGQVPAHRPGAADQLPALPGRAPPPDPALQLHRTHLRRDPPPRQGHRPAARRDSCLNLVWAVLDRASRGWRGMTMTTDRHPPAADLRHQLLDPPTPIRRPNTDTADAPNRNCRSRRLTSPTRNRVRRHLHRTWDATTRSRRSARRAKLDCRVGPYLDQGGSAPRVARRRPSPGLALAGTPGTGTPFL